jgi:DNA-binding CsgD family transcriptional regulator
VSAEELEQGREAFARRAWRDAYESLSRADAKSPLGAEDLELLATSTWMVGRMDEYVALLERLHHQYLEAGESLRAAWYAGWLGMNLALGGEIGPAGGWFGRAQRLVEREGRECVEQGWLLIPALFQSMVTGDYDAAYDAATGGAEIGERFGDADLFAAATHFRGLIRVKQGRVEEGLGHLDEAMVGVIAGELSPVMTGIVYCGVIASCEEAFEARRAHEWTSALTRWCEQQPQMVAFTGRCLAHRAGIKLLHGAWEEALEEALVARERCEQAMNWAATGQALYQQGEILRLQGRFEEAEQAYADANRYGREPQPGLALLRLGQGNAQAAAAAIRRVLGETTDPLPRAGLLPAYAEIMLAAGQNEEARAACFELEEIAAASNRALLTAVAAYVRGAVELAEGDAQAALISLRRSLQEWQSLEAPYEAARVRALIGQACRALDDDDTAELELDAARSVFDQLGAASDLAGLDVTPAGATHGLTARELEVLRLVAAGKTNREIASILVVSEHTVARHIQNIFGKLRVSSRTAAAAFAYERDLV